MEHRSETVVVVGVDVGIVVVVAEVVAVVIVGSVGGMVTTIGIKIK